MSQIHIHARINGLPAHVLTGWSRPEQAFFLYAWVEVMTDRDPEAVLEVARDIPTLLGGGEALGIYLSPEQTARLIPMLADHRARNAGNEVEFLGSEK